MVGVADQCLSTRWEAQINCVCDMNGSILTSSTYLASVLFHAIRTCDSQVAVKTLPIELEAWGPGFRQMCSAYTSCLSVGRCEIKCEIEQVAALRLVGVCYSGIPRCSFCGPASSENILTDPC